MHDPIKPAPLPLPAISFPAVLLANASMRDIQHLIEYGKQYGCFRSKSAAKDPALVADPADPQPSDRVPQIAASSSGHAAIISRFYCDLQLIISYRSHLSPAMPAAAISHHRGADISCDRGNSVVDPPPYRPILRSNFWPGLSSGHALQHPTSSPCQGKPRISSSGSNLCWSKKSTPGALGSECLQADRRRLSICSSISSSMTPSTRRHLEEAVEQGLIRPTRPSTSDHRRR